VGVGRDITALKDAEAAVEDQRRFLRTVIDAVSDPILVITHEYRVKMANAAACRLYAWGDADGPEGVASGCCHIITHRSEQPCSRSGETCPLEQALAAGGSVRSMHRHYLDGAERYVEVSASPYWGLDGEVEGVVEVGRDITDELAAQERVQFLAHHDVLTGLPNRVQLYERFAAAAETAAKEHLRVGLLYLDLDRFKQVNDNLGHHIGDLLLQEISRRLDGVMRRTDTVSRQGGDEFLVVLAELQDGAEALSVAEKIRASLEGPIVLDGHSLVATFSIGAAILPEDGTDFDTLLKHADLAMYAAKATGRNRVRSYDPTMERRVRARTRATT
jgi:diguanylate cyclase (GGDEF)-like protein